MSAYDDLRESMKDPAVRGQYLAAIRNRGKDVLIANVTEALDLLIEMTVKVQSAEAERDELRKMLTVTQDGETEAINHAVQFRDNLKASSANAMAWMKRALLAEKELGWRDAAAGEPFAYARRLVRIASGDAEQWKVTRTLAENSEGILYRNEVMPLYAAAPQDILPTVANEREAFNAWNNDDNLPIAGVPAKNAAWLAWQARAALGAQAQKVVDFSKCRTLWYDHDDLSAEVKCIPWRDVKAALDAANVPYAVKK